MCRIPAFAVAFMMLLVSCKEQVINDQSKNGLTFAETYRASHCLPQMEQNPGKWNGNYINRNDSLKIFNETNSRFYFQMKVVADLGNCVGEVDGYAFVDSKNSNHFQFRSPDKECTLDFKLSGSGSVQVAEESCGYHGAQCSFTGVYSKK